MDDIFEQNEETNDAVSEVEKTESDEYVIELYEESMQKPPACNNTFFQTDLISVPVKVTPFAKTGHVKTVCCGSPVITTGRCMHGDTGKVCEFTITQKICVKIPLAFGASVSIDHAHVQCGGISETECDCKPPCLCDLD